MSSLSVRQAAVQQVSTVIAGLLLCVREIVDWAVVATLLLCLAGRLLASLRGQRKGAASMMRLAGSGERYLGTRGSSDDDRLPNFRLHHIHRPGDGTSGSKSKFCSARSATHHPPVSEHIGFASKGMSASFARPSRAVTPPLAGQIPWKAGGVSPSCGTGSRTTAWRRSSSRMRATSPES